MRASPVHFCNRWYPIWLWIATLGLTLADGIFIIIQFQFALVLPWHAHLLFYSALLIKGFILKTLITHQGPLKAQIYALALLLCANSVIGMIDLWTQATSVSLWLFVEKFLIIAASLLLALPLKRSLTP